MEKKNRSYYVAQVVRGIQMVVSQIGGIQYRPQNTMILIVGTPKEVTLIWGNPQTPNS